MSGVTWEDVAGLILREVRATYPNGRKPDAEIAGAWARALARSRRVYPASVWREAVTVWAVSHSEPPTPHDLIVSAGQVVDQWDLDPVRKLEMERFRRSRLESRMDGRLESGREYGAEHAEVTAEERRALEAGERGSGRRHADRFRDELRARAEARRERSAVEHERVRELLDVTEDDPWPPAQ